MFSVSVTDESKQQSEDMNREDSRVRVHSPAASEALVAAALSALRVASPVVVANTLLSAVGPKPAFWAALSADCTLSSTMETSARTQ